MAKKPVKAEPVTESPMENIEAYSGDTKVVAVLPPISQATLDYAVLREAYKIKTDSKRLTAARAIGHVPV